eukprot:c9022_g1_i3.p1 GENE.c9022_g1_i3~~c9022_g1_i3.p1  ORF type:complete len:188 (-),score=22.20 c9022_g1_i3:11-574(-)
MINRVRSRYHSGASFFSPVFVSAHWKYSFRLKACVRVKHGPNQDFFLCGLTLVPSEDSASLSWPFPCLFSVTVLDAFGDVVATQSCDPTLEHENPVFQQPDSQNDDAFGFYLFTWKDLDVDTIVVNDRMRVVLRLSKRVSSDDTSRKVTSTTDEGISPNSTPKDITLERTESNSELKNNTDDTRQQE